MRRPFNRLAAAPRAARLARLAALLTIAVLIEGTLASGAVTAADRGSTDSQAKDQTIQTTVTADSAVHLRPDGDGAAGVAAAAGAATATPAGVPAADPGPGLHQTIQYEEAVAHEADRIAFAPGERVTVGYSPRAADTWAVDGHAPRALPAGNASGRAMASSPQGRAWSTQPPPALADPTTGPTDAPAVDLPAVDAGATQSASDASVALPAPSATYTPEGTGLIRQVFGFLPYWELSDSSTTLNYDVLSTVAYFSVGADKYGNLLKRNADGSTTTGWSGWTSTKMTSLIGAAHRKHTRVVLTVSVFAWTSAETAKQIAILGSSSARLNLARQAAAAVRDRGADGINLDFEPIASGYADEFTAFVRTLRAELNRIAPGYQLTFDTTGYIGNYPIEAATASGAADAIFVMGYDYRTAGANPVGSLSPLTGLPYDLTDTVRAYLARVPASKVILGVPYYGRAWSTDTNLVHAANISGTKYGPSATVVYTSLLDYVARYGRHYDAIEQAPWVAYQRQNCTATYGCVTSWREIYYDDVVSLKAKYDLVNRYALRGVGMWALGYDGTRTELNKALADKFLHDTTPPSTGIRTIGWRQRDAGFAVAWSGYDISGIATYDVQVSMDGGAWANWRIGTTATSDVFVGASGHGYAFRARGRDTKGNLGAWDVTSTWKQTPTLAVGGFGGVRVDGLSMRGAPDSSAAKFGELNTGQIVSIVGGPKVADGYTWWQVSGPLGEWRAVSPIDEGLWVSAGPTSSPYLIASRAPNSTIVDAVLRGFSVGIDGRAFSPNGDGQRDTMLLAWANASALDSLTLRVYRADGSLAGSIALPDRAAGAQTYDWDGTLGGVRVPDGTYMVALSATIDGATFSAPSSTPVTVAQLATFGVTVDTVAPLVSTASASGWAFSPNGDGTLDTIQLKMSGSGLTGWTFSAAPIIGPATGAALRTASGAGTTAAFTWNGRANDGTAVPDGNYRLVLRLTDAAGNGVARSWDVRLDTRRPVVGASVTPARFSPNGDSSADAATVAWSSDEGAAGTMTVIRETTTYRRWTIATAGSLAWNGRSTSGAAVPDGRYTLRVDLHDGAGNRTRREVSVVVDRTVGWLRWSPSLFYPQDGDGYAPRSTVSFTLIRSATTTLRIYDAAGNTVRTAWANRSLGKGSWSWAWNGRNGAGRYVARGIYHATLTVTSAYGTTVLSRSIVADAFAVSLSGALHAGQAVTLTLRSAEPLKAAPVVTLGQPGRTPVARGTTLASSGVYRVTFTLPSGVTGPATFAIAARDGAGRAVSQLLQIVVQ